MLQRLLLWFCGFGMIVLFHEVGFTQQPTLAWGGGLTGLSSDVICGIAVDSQGNVYTSGYFRETVDFDFTSSNYSIYAGDATQGFICKYNSSGDLIWAYKLEGDTVIMRDIILDENNNSLYFSGTFNGTIDFDLSGGTDIFNSSNGYDGFLVKLDTSGALIWGKVQEGNLNGNCGHLSIDENGNIFTIGDFESSVDLDPNAGVLMINRPANGNFSCFLAKYDPDGNYLWHYTNELSEEDFIISGFDILPGGEYFISGSFGEPLDFDPGSADFLMSASNQNAFFLKLSDTGDFLWANKFFSGSPIFSGPVECDDSGSTYCSGKFLGTINLSFTSTSNFHSSNGSYDAYLVKIDGSGSIEWVNVIGSIGWDDYTFVAIDGLGYPYVFGNYEGEFDLDPGAGIEISPSYGNEDLFVQRFDPAGDLIWTATMGGMINDNVLAFFVDDNASIYTTGKFKGVIDVDPDTSFFNLNSTGIYYDPFIAKWTQDSCSFSYIKLDSVSDVSCSTGPGYIGTHVVNAIGDVTYYWNSLPSIDSSNVSITSSGIYTFTTIDTTGCEHSKSILIEGPLYATGFDLGVELIANNFRAGFTTHVWLEANNFSCNPEDAQIKFLPHPGQLVSNSTPSPDQYLGDTLVWNISGIYYNSLTFPVLVDLFTPSYFDDGDDICLYAEIKANTADNDSMNDSQYYCDQVVNSCDPNDIAVLPAGICQPNFVTIDQKLKYKIRFQNTGTAEAINIIIHDTLAPELYLNTLSVIASSHDVITEVESWGVKFTFDDIYLPDSNSNEPLSHGYVVFEISPLNTISPYTSVLNSASIFFDYNAPVITNTAQTTFVDELPLLDTLISVVACESFELNGVAYPGSGVYYQNLSSVFGCDSIITIDLTITAIDVSTSVTDLEITANNFSALTYQWLNCNDGNSPILGATGQSFTPNVDGNYAVVITENGCTDTSACVNISGIGVNENNNNLFEIYPNPVSHELTISFNENFNAEKILILNNEGKIVCQINDIHQSIVVIDVSYFAPGVYTINLVSNNNISHLKLIKL